MIKTENFIIVHEKSLDKIVECGLLFHNALSNPGLAKNYMERSDLFCVYNHDNTLLYIGEVHKLKWAQLKGPRNIQNYTQEEVNEIKEALVVNGLLDPLAEND